MRREIKIKQVNNPDQKSEIVEEVLLDLPEWFGLPESTQEYIEQSRELPLLVAKEENNIIGFITLKKTSEATCEIYCMGVKRRYHRQGIGQSLYKQFEQLAEETYDFVQVKTVDEGHYVEYDQTIAFYLKLGFKKLEVFPTLWDKWNPCLIMVKKLNKES